MYVCHACLHSTAARGRSVPFGIFLCSAHSPEKTIEQKSIGLQHQTAGSNVFTLVLIPILVVNTIPERLLLKKIKKFLKYHLRFYLPLKNGKNPNIGSQSCRLLN